MVGLSIGQDSLFGQTRVTRFVEEYDSFGKVLTTSGTVDTRYKYTGRELDAETGLYYYRARYFDANVGRFIGQDPIGFSAGDSNLYRYVGNSPLNATDPSGEFRVPVPIRVRVRTKPGIPAPPVITPTPQPLPQPNPQPGPRPNPNACINQCYPCESKRQGGAYKEVRNANRNPGAEVHHTPAWKSLEMSGIKLGRGGRRGKEFDIAPAICMVAGEHLVTASRGSGDRAKNYRMQQATLIRQGDFEVAQNLDIVELRTKYGNKYSIGIIQMRNYTKQLKASRPDLFKP
jgi:RHS repeat-associated protein